jgi:hypothetical protein
MMSRYRLTAPIRAIHHAVEGAEIADLCVTLPVGAVLVESVLESSLIGMLDVYWERRHYSVHGRDLFRKAERVLVA